jgi:hypothetical protein
LKHVRYTPFTDFALEAKSALAFSLSTVPVNVTTPPTVVTFTVGVNLTRTESLAKASLTATVSIN